MIAAFKQGHLDVVKYLKEAGAEVDAEATVSIYVSIGNYNEGCHADAIVCISW